MTEFISHKLTVLLWRSRLKTAMSAKTDGACAIVTSRIMYSVLQLSGEVVKEIMISPEFDKVQDRCSFMADRDKDLVNKIYDEGGEEAFTLWSNVNG